MNVRDMIAALSQFDPDLPVYVVGGEGALDDADAAVKVDVARDYYRTEQPLSSFGAHDRYDWGDEETRDLTPGVAIVRTFELIDGSRSF